MKTSGIACFLLFSALLLSSCNGECCSDPYSDKKTCCIPSEKCVVTDGKVICVPKPIKLTPIWRPFWRPLRRPLVWGFKGFRFVKDIFQQRNEPMPQNDFSPDRMESAQNPFFFEE